jgi:hypothetical protein
MASRTEESRTDLLTRGFRSALGEELFENVAVRRDNFSYRFARGIQDGLDLFAATSWLLGLLACCIEGCGQNEAAERAILAGRRLRQRAMLLRCGANAEWLADCG